MRYIGRKRNKKSFREMFDEGMKEAGFKRIPVGETQLEKIRLYRTEVPGPMGGEQSLVLIENEDQLYGFVSCVCHSDLYAHTEKEIADDLKKYMEDNQVTPVEVQDSELVRKVIEKAEQVGTGVSESLTWNLRALLESC